MALLDAQRSALHPSPCSEHLHRQEVPRGERHEARVRGEEGLELREGITDVPGRAAVDGVSMIVYFS